MKKVVVTGASGFIGNSLSKFLENKNFQIIRLQRNKNNIKDKNIIKWELGENFPSKALLADIFIYCAHDNDPLNINKKLEDDINYQGLKLILQSIREKNNYEIYFISSQSSKKNSKSYYGRLKFKMELLLDNKKNNKIETIIRPGMVYDKENSYVAELIKKILKFKIFPFFSFKKNIQPIHINDLNECIYKIISKDKDLKLSEYNLAVDHQINIREFVKFICKDNNLKFPFFIYIPYFLIIILCKLADITRLTKYSLLERVYGLFYLPRIKTKYHLQSINYKLKNNFFI